VNTMEQRTQPKVHSWPIYLLLLALPVMTFESIAASTPSISINNLDESIDVSTRDKLSIQLNMSDTESPPPQADWWLVLEGPEGSTKSFSLSSNEFQVGLFTTHQGTVVDFPNILLTTIAGLTAGTHNLYFGIDKTANGALDLDSVVYDSITLNVTTDEESSRHSRLENAETWMYQIQGLDEDGAIPTLTATPYPMLVLEPGHNFNDFTYDTESMISDLRAQPGGGR